MAQEVYKEKARFVKKLQLFYARDVRGDEGIKRLDYLYDESIGSEFVYVSYESYSQRRFNVVGDDNEGILIDFIDFLKDRNQKKYFWIMPNDAAFRKDFLEDE